ncbi:hypothetical protein AB6G19_04545 [Providencia manganoxydans]|uniref:Uncharacterized protein n=1 Tax=Providencia manganoxydans TaxID=2923283 RepID=A0ABX7AC64_9GAMM|nr:MULTISPECIES: hypothetical protein [Providencia]MDX4947468.1 hypothetical protein [Providencia manganoxydans]QQO61553.1 hypothetical protein JI723_14955 [Providencia manganoxydans]
MDKSRQKFEYWYFNNHSHEQKYPLHKDESGGYFYDGTRKAWVAWQASRESLINSLEPVGYISEDGLNSLSENSDAITSSKQQYNKVIPLYKLD